MMLLSFNEYVTRPIISPKTVDSWSSSFLWSYSLSLVLNHGFKIMKNACIIRYIAKEAK